MREKMVYFCRYWKLGALEIEAHVLAIVAFRSGTQPSISYDHMQESRKDHSARVRQGHWRRQSLEIEGEP